MALPDAVELLCLAVGKRAASEAEKIREQAGSEYERLVEQGRQQLKREFEDKKLRLKRQAFQDARRVVDAAELRSRRMVMAVREEILDAVIRAGRQGLEAMREKEPGSYVELLQGMITNALDIMKDVRGSVVIRGAGRDREYISQAVSVLPQEVRGRLKVSEDPVDISGGILAAADNGRQLVDLSFDTVLKRMEPQIRALVSERLFRGD